MPKPKGLIFPEASVLSMLNGTKTMTRRLQGLELVNAEPERWKIAGTQRCDGIVIPRTDGSKDVWNGFYSFFEDMVDETADWQFVKCPWNIGDQIYAKETWWISDVESLGLHAYVQYKADRTIGERYIPPDIRPLECDPDGKWRSPLFMPRWAARHELSRKITGIRCERVQDISDEDCEEEGTPGHLPDCPFWPEETVRWLPVYDSGGCQINGDPVCDCGDYWLKEIYQKVWDSLHAKPRAVRGNSKWAKVLGWQRKDSKDAWDWDRRNILGYISFPFTEEDGDYRTEINGKPHFRCVNSWCWVLQFGEGRAV